MARRPLRPLASILKARSEGKNPDNIELDARAKRNRDQQDDVRKNGELRLLLLSVAFFAAFTVLGGKMAFLSASEPLAKSNGGSGETIRTHRADIVDRNGSVLATNLITTSLYAHPQDMIEPHKAATGLAQIFPDLNEIQLIKDFTGKRKFLWIKKKLSPEQRQLVHDLGEPGLHFGPREMRLYPNGKLASHILGGATYGKEGVHAAELIGVAGIEKFFDEKLRDPEQSPEPLMLSIDIATQAATERVLHGGMALMNAKAATAILMDAHTGEIVSMASLPDFDPNNRPRPLITGDQADSPLFNRAAQGVYELGSTFKLFTAAVSLDKGLVNPDTKINTKGPLVWGKYKIRDFHDYGSSLSVTDVIVKSSNIGTARMALEAGSGAQQAFLSDLGMFDPLKLELSEAGTARPLLPKRWSDLSTMTVSYGHGIAASPLHLAGAYATLVNGGMKITPTLIKQPANPPRGERILKEETSDALRVMLRAVVERGTASFGNVPGYEVGGKTGSADKPNPKGGYHDDKVISTFASAFPMSDPKYVLIVTMDEPSISAHGEARRTAGWTAVPVAAEIISRVAPILDMRPIVDPVGQVKYTQID